MQDKVNEKVVSLAIKTSKLTAGVLQSAIKALLKKRRRAAHESSAWKSYYAAAYETGRKSNEY